VSVANPDAVVRDFTQLVRYAYESGTWRALGYPSPDELAALVAAEATSTPKRRNAASSASPKRVGRS
jgi:hypothetical protein